MAASLADIGAVLMSGLTAFAAEQHSELVRVGNAVYELRDALASGDKVAVGKAAKELCDVEYSVRGDCEIFGGLVDHLKDAGLVPEDFEAELGT